MGGLGSGGANHSGRSTVEERPKLAIIALQKAGALRAGAWRVWRWTRGGEECASIGVHGANGAVRLEYCLSEGDRPPRRIDARIEIDWRACRFGGRRALFRCPQCCGSALNLYLAGGRFCCRACARLTYACRRERSRDRNLRAANKIRARLGGEGGALGDFTERPKRMWRSTYRRLVAEIERREGFALEELAGWMMKLDGRRGAKGFWR